MASRGPDWTNCLDNNEALLKQLQTDIAMLLPKQILKKLQDGDLTGPDINAIRQYLDWAGVKVGKPEANKDILKLAEGIESLPFKGTKAG